MERARSTSNCNGWSEEDNRWLLEWNKEKDEICAKD